MPQSAPYCMRKDSSEKLTGNAQYEGYSLDLIHEISRILGFNYTFRLVPDGRYGSYNKQTKEWDGMMKELLDQKADLAIADLTITYDREQAVDFTMPFMNLGELSGYSRRNLVSRNNADTFISVSLIERHNQPLMDCTTWEIELNEFSNLFTNR